MKRKDRLINVGLIALLGISAATLALHSRAQAAPVTCEDRCSNTQFIKSCTNGKYHYLTKKSCIFCGGVLGKYNCVKRTLGPHCVENKTEQMDIKLIMSFEVCSCTDLNGNPFAFAEAKEVEVDPGLPGDTVNWWRCLD